MVPPIQKNSAKNFKKKKINRKRIFKWAPNTKSLKHRKDVTELLLTMRKLKAFSWSGVGVTLKVWVIGLKDNWIQDLVKAGKAGFRSPAALQAREKNSWVGLVPPEFRWVTERAEREKHNQTGFQHMGEICSCYLLVYFFPY